MHRCVKHLPPQSSIQQPRCRQQGNAQECRRLAGQPAALRPLHYDAQGSKAKQQWCALHCETSNILHGVCPPGRRRNWKAFTKHANRTLITSGQVCEGACGAASRVSCMRGVSGWVFSGQRKTKRNAVKSALGSRRPRSPLQKVLFPNDY